MDIFKMKRQICITCVCSTVGVFSTVGEVPWGVQYRGGHHEYRGGYLEYHGGYSVPGRYYDAGGGYHEYCGVFSTIGGYHLLQFEYRGGCHDTSGGYHEYLGGVQ